MATFKTEIQNRRADGTYNVRIRVTHNRVVRRISTNIYVSDCDLTKGGKIKNPTTLSHCDALIRKCRDACTELGYGIAALTTDELVERIKETLVGGSSFRLDFLAYADRKTENMTPGTASAYRIAFGALRRYIGRNTLDIGEINVAFLRGFEQFIETEPSRQGANRKGMAKGLKRKGERAVSAYLGCVRAIHNKAKAEYNDEDRGIIRIPYSPFKNYKIKPQPRTRKRALPVEVIQRMIDLPYEEERIGGKWSRFNLAKDCFILSFALIGMNSADLFYTGTETRGVLLYNRKKTASRRDDKAEMRVRLEPCLSRLLEKYRDPERKRMFNFYNHYSGPENFNKALNTGLKQIGRVLGVEKLEFYAARHSWATIARSAAVDIDKATVHEALNHVDGEMKVTDIYIERDWSVIWNANAKVLALFDWTAVGWEVL